MKKKRIVSGIRIKELLLEKSNELQEGKEEEYN